MDTKSCPKCGATWVDGQHYWHTGKIGSEVDLAGLVCNNLGDETCVNPMVGSEIGDTWEKRLVSLRKYGKEDSSGEIENL
jgi:hypothetical protein